MRREDKSTAIEDIGAAMDDWFANERDATPLHDAYRELEGGEQLEADLYPIFVALRPSHSQTIAVPVEIAMAGLTPQNEILLWHTEIAPLEHWQNHVATHDLRDLAKALTAQDVAQAVVSRANRTPTGTFHALRPDQPKALLVTLMREHPINAPVMPVLPFPKAQYGKPKSDRFSECIEYFLKDRQPDDDPVTEATGLASLWAFASKRYGTN